MEDSIQFYTEDLEFVLPSELPYKVWLQTLADRENVTIESLTFIFCSDAYLHTINVEYLDHDTFTDIITFPYQEGKVISGDVFISIDRIRENALTYYTSFHDELLRVMAHGVLHLCGYGDKNDIEKARMREKEDEAIKLYKARQKL